MQVSAERVEEKTHSRYDGASSAPIFANGAVTGSFSYLFRAGVRSFENVRLPGLVYLTAHEVGGIGPYHLALEYTDGRGPHWISAGPQNGLLVSGEDGQRPTDSPELNLTIDKISSPSGVSPGDYFSSLRQTDLNYCDCVRYSPVPEVASGYNSNGYIRGLVQATGGSTAVNLDRFVGGSKPVPANNFKLP